MHITRSNHQRGGDVTQEETMQPAQADSSEATSREALDTLTAKVKEYEDLWMRSRAEFANYKKRVDAQMQDSYTNASSDVLKSLLPIIDDFDRALMNVPDELEAHPWISGTSMIQKKMVKLLDDFGVQTVDPTGETFDPNQHEAVAMDATSDQESGTITATLQKGYVIGDKVLRPALVRVAQ
jgi:molecular chaperone GrpE